MNLASLRQKVGPPGTFGPVEAVIFLMTVVAYIMAWIAIVNPTWKTWADVDNNYYSIGLWTACRNGICFNAWQTQRPASVQMPSGQTVGTFFFYDFTPPRIETAQAFLIMGLFMHLFSCWLWGGALMAATSLVIPAIFYTIGVSVGATFFDLAQSTVTTEFEAQFGRVIKIEWGYAASCGFAAVILTWLAILLFTGDHVFRKKVWNRRVELNSNTDIEIQ